MSDASASASASASTADVDSGASLDAYVDSSDRIVAKTVDQYEDFVKRRRRVVDVRKWTKIRSERGIDLYRERVEAHSRPIFVSRSRDRPSLQEVGKSPSGEVETTMVSAFGGGSVPGTLDELMQGLHADTTELMQQNAAIQFGDTIASGVVRVFRTQSDKHPHEFFGVKFIDKWSSLPGVVDHLCWVEVRYRWMCMAAVTMY